MFYSPGCKSPPAGEPAQAEQESVSASVYRRGVNSQPAAPQVAIPADDKHCDKSKPSAESAETPQEATPVLCNDSRPSTSSQLYQEQPQDAIKVTLHEEEVAFELHQGATHDEHCSATAFQAVLHNNPPSGQLPVTFQHTASSCKLGIKLDKETAVMLPLLADLVEWTDGNDAPLAFKPPGSIWEFAICAFLLEEESDYMCQDRLDMILWTPPLQASVTRCGIFELQ